MSVEWENAGLHGRRQLPEGVVLFWPCKKKACTRGFHFHRVVWIRAPAGGFRM